MCLWDPLDTQVPRLYKNNVNNIYFVRLIEIIFKNEVQLLEGE